MQQQTKKPTSFSKQNIRNKSDMTKNKEVTRSKLRGQRCFLQCKGIWGDVFDLKNIKPYSINIRSELIEDAKAKGIEISACVIYSALHWAVNTYVYQKQLIVSDWRFDMNHNKTTKITPDQKQLAQEKILLIKQRLKNNPRKTKMD